VSERIRIVFLIRSLTRGGAERQLSVLAEGLDPAVFDVLVLTFYPGGAVWCELEKVPHVQLRSLHKRGRWDNVRTVRALARILRAWRPLIIHAYLVEASIVALLAARLGSTPIVVWGVRASNVDYSQYGTIHWLTFRAAGMLSHFADLIVANSESGRAHCVRHGYRSDRFAVILNGIDTDRFRPRADARSQMRAEWGIASGEVLVGIAARIDPMKGHHTFLQAAAEVARANRNVRFVCIGAGDTRYAAALRAAADGFGLDAKLLWVGERGDMERVYPALDIACSSSLFGEGFSNAVGEAMACGTPCVVTDVGDSATIVGDTGTVVRPGSADALVTAILGMAGMTPPDRVGLGLRARARVVQLFSMREMIERTAASYRQLAVSHKRPAGMLPA
jgi:glycosyltransferase involved in cell wall biosynthesis